MLLCHAAALLDLCKYDRGVWRGRHTEGTVGPERSPSASSARIRPYPPPRGIIVWTSASYLAGEKRKEEEIV